MASRPKTPPAPTTAKTGGKSAAKTTDKAVRKPVAKTTAATAAKSAKPAKPGTESAPVPAPVPAAPAAAQPVITTLKLRELVERVAAATGTRKKEVKATVEAVLDEIGRALEQGHALNLPSFGKARVARAGDAASGQAMVLKLRRSGSGSKKKDGDQALAEDGEAG